MDEELRKYLTLPEYLEDRERSLLIACHHSNGEHVRHCIECEEENRILSQLDE
jgi:hypothetical protein